MGGEGPSKKKRKGSDRNADYRPQREAQVVEDQRIG